MAVGGILRRPVMGPARQTCGRPAQAGPIRPPEPGHYGRPSNREAPARDPARPASGLLARHITPAEQSGPTIVGGISPRYPQDTEDKGQAQ